MAILAMSPGITSCVETPETAYRVYKPLIIPADSLLYSDDPLWKRHHDSSLKILAIGNSFTINATSFMPWLIDCLDGDSVCIAMLTRSGCTLQQHWASHIADSSDYDLHYSDNGDWTLSGLKTMDAALTLFDWDIITIQQASGLSGIYNSYQPYLKYLVRIFKEASPFAKLAWHTTWAYTPWTEHPEFKKYGYDSGTMYEAIMEAGYLASEDFDIIIPSATLVKWLWEEFPEVENGFSSDGYHIDASLGQYALSSLWYEELITPSTGTSTLNAEVSPPDFDPVGMEKVRKIVGVFNQTHLRGLPFL